MRAPKREHEPRHCASVLSSNEEQTYCWEQSKETLTHSDRFDVECLQSVFVFDVECLQRVLLCRETSCLLNDNKVLARRGLLSCSSLASSRRLHSLTEVQNYLNDCTTDTHTHLEKQKCTEKAPWALSNGLPMEHIL